MFVPLTELLQKNQALLTYCHYHSSQDLDIERSPATCLYIAQLDNAGNLSSKPRQVEIEGSRHVSAIAFRKDEPGSYLCTTHTGLAYLSEATGQVVDIPGNFNQIIPEDEKDSMRFNDAVCDSKGHFYFHSMSRDETKRKGKLYMYSPEMTSMTNLKVLAEDFAIGNGPVIDEERGRFYFNVTTDGIGCKSVMCGLRRLVILLMLCKRYLRLRCGKWTHQQPERLFQQQ